MFAIITPALITGAFAERKRFKAFVVFSLLWSTLVYAPRALGLGANRLDLELGALDFAGGTVVHICPGLGSGRGPGDWQAASALAGMRWNRTT